MKLEVSEIPISLHQSRLYTIVCKNLSNPTKALIAEIIFHHGELARSTKAIDADRHYVAKLQFGTTFLKH